MKHDSAMKRDIAIFILLLLLGVGTLVYPYIQRRLFDNRTQITIAEFEKRIDAYKLTHQQRMLNSGDSNDIPPEEDPRFWLNTVKLFLAFMNHRLYEENQAHLVDPFRYIHPCFNIQPFGLDTDIVGILSIPAIDINLPIYLGTSFQHLNSGVAHLTHSSFPVGGNNTNAVIAGHRNLQHGRVFRDIEQLEIGDEITIANFINTMTYVVVETKIAGPHEIEALTIQSGRDLVTLVTTHTRRRGNQRYIIVAERVG
ncbi:MAG: class C sortase [Defluviitaleaceae bacterium]|nr:class C sortase [Defluviitaleaceae bacterium]